MSLRAVIVLDKAKNDEKSHLLYLILKENGQKYFPLELFDVYLQIEIKR